MLNLNQQAQEVFDTLSKLPQEELYTIHRNASKSTKDEAIGECRIIELIWEMENRTHLINFLFD